MSTHQKDQSLHKNRKNIYKAFKKILSKARELKTQREQSLDPGKIYLQTPASESSELAGLGGYRHLFNHWPQSFWSLP